MGAKDNEDDTRDDAMGAKDDEDDTRDAKDAEDDDVDAEENPPPLLFYCLRSLSPSPPSSTTMWGWGCSS